MRDSKALYARVLSCLARYQPNTYSSLQAIKTTAFLPRWIPSTYTTSKISSINGGIGHISQNRAVLYLNARPPPGISTCLCLLNSQAKNSSRFLASVFILCVFVQPHFLHRHRCLPEELYPCLFIVLPQIGHLGALIFGITDKKCVWTSRVSTDMECCDAAHSRPILHPIQPVHFDLWD